MYFRCIAAVFLDLFLHVHMCAYMLQCVQACVSLHPPAAGSRRQKQTNISTSLKTSDCSSLVLTF